MGTELKVVGKPKAQKWETLSMVEMLAQDEWFVRARTPRGATLWYVRWSVTGLFPRLFGPFRTRRQGLLFLDDTIDASCDCWNELEDACAKYRVKGEFKKLTWGPLIEHPVLTQNR